jgi:regulator of protease activity HflC (stomatin/prohibitin superfamily)
MDFLSADGFPITLDGAIEFRIVPEKVAEVFVKYNEEANGDAIDDEIIAKVITPESRALCRIGGSKLTGGQFISGEDREKFQRDLVTKLTENCKKQGVEVLAVAITTIQPPNEIAGPVRDREVAKQQLAQFQQEKIQQQSEAQLKVQTVLAQQKKELVEAEQGVVEKTTKADQEQAVAVTLAEQKLKVAQTQLDAAKDKASAITSKAEADAAVIRYNNEAEVAGLATRVEAFRGDGSALARNSLVTKLAPAFRSVITNTEGPLMDLFGRFQRGGTPSPSPSRGSATAALPDKPFTPSPEGSR